MKHFIFLLSAFLFFSEIHAQHAGNVRYNKNRKFVNKSKISNSVSGQTDLPAQAGNPNNTTYSFNIQSIYNAESKAYVAIFNLTQLAPTIQSADSIINKRFQDFKKGLIELKVLEKDIFIDMISQVPIYEVQVEKKLFSKNYLEIPKGIEVQKNIHITYTDGNILDKIVSLAAKNEIYDLVKVDYFIENQEAIFAELRKKSIELVNKRIEEYKALGIRLDTAFRAFSDQKAVIYPIDRYQNYQAFSSASLEGNKKKKVDEAEVKQIRKPNSMFYQQIPYHHYDIVVNPVVKAPAVQFTYNLRVRFEYNIPTRTIIKKEKVIEQKTNKEFILISPEGAIKTLKME